MRTEIDTLADRYELGEGRADVLDGLIRLADWGAPNFVPKSDPSRLRGQRRRPEEQQRRVATNVLAESLSALKLESVRAAHRVADIGSGAGFPGLVVAIALPKAHVALIDRAHEACSFLRFATTELGVDNVEVVERRAQRWPEGLGTFDVVTSRKARPLPRVVALSAPLLAPGGAVAVWPGSSDFSGEAVAAATDEADAAGLRLTRTQPVESKTRNGSRRVKHLYLYEKIGAFGHRPGKWN